MNTIPLTDPAVERIKSLVPEPYHAQTWIAGSAATNWGQNNDVDAWVCHITYDNERPLFQRFNELGRVPDFGEEHYADGSMMLYAQDGLHILANYESIASVVMNFDISCHAAAINIVTGEQFVHPAYTPLVRPINWMSAPKTLLRVLKFAERYYDRTAYRAPECQALAIATFRLPKVTSAEVEMVKLLKLQEGL